MPFLLLMPSFNQSHYIADAVRSVLAQDDPDWELWIVDNSSDDTPKVMSGFQDPRIHFHHIPARMDPGTCLNWMLERVKGRDFSYVHTDNNLAPSYVRHMRQALAADPLSLAYCDMRVIDDHGRRIRVDRRGEFDLARLLSLQPLGVPFSATTELAQRLGGFSSRDAADDVRFCTLAYGMARFTHLREPLIDYRLHAGSRTEEHGGSRKMHLSFLKTYAHVVPELERRQLQPLEHLARAVGRELDDIDLLVEDAWYRSFARDGVAWEGSPGLESLFQARVLALPCQGSSGRIWVKGAGSRNRLPPTPGLLLKLFKMKRRLRRELKAASRRLPAVLLPWAYLSLGTLAADKTVRFSTDTLDARTLWCATLLAEGLGWEWVRGAGAGIPRLRVGEVPELGA